MHVTFVSDAEGVESSRSNSRTHGVISCTDRRCIGRNVFVVCLLLHLLLVLHVHPWILVLHQLLVRVLAVG